MILAAEQLLSQLVAIPSVNPMGRTGIDPSICGESRMTAFLGELFHGLGLPAIKQTVHAQQENVIAWVEGEIPGLLLLEAHQDTVPVDGMTISPFEPAIREGRLYGRGACDVKGGMAAMLTAFARMAQEPISERPTIVMACTVNEEHGFTGATALRMFIQEEQGPFSQQPSAVIVAEPTQLQVVASHKGAVRWRCHVHGKATHSSRPHLGDNAIYRMVQVVAAIESFQQHLVQTGKTDPLCGSPAVSVTTIRGGISVNTVPDLCTIEIDRRLIPGEAPRRAYQELIDWIAEAIDDASKVEHELPFSESPGLAYDETNSLAARLAGVARRVAGASQIVGAPYGTDASVLASRSIPAVVFGPGNIEQAHTADEWIDLDELHQAAEIYSRFAREFRA